MPLLVTFRGRPVKFRRRVGDRLRLVFFSPIRGRPSEIWVVSQEAWSRHGRVQFYPREHMPDVRTLAARLGAQEVQHA